jgi:hypothetical protein
MRKLILQASENIVYVAILNAMSELVVDLESSLKYVPYADKTVCELANGSFCLCTNL